VFRWANRDLRRSYEERHFRGWGGTFAGRFRLTSLLRRAIAL